MKKNQLIIKLVLLVLIGVMVLSFIPSAAAFWPWQPRCSCYRPIEDVAVNGYLGGFGDPATDNVIRFNFWWLDYEYTGFIYEQHLADGSFKLSITLEMHGTYVLGTQWSTGQEIFHGHGDFVWDYVIILHEEIPGGWMYWSWGDEWVEPGIRTCGSEIPSLIAIFIYSDIIGAEIQFLECKGTAIGDGFFGDYDEFDQEIWVPAEAYCNQLYLFTPFGDMFLSEDIIYTPL